MAHSRGEVALVVTCVVMMSTTTLLHSCGLCQPSWDEWLGLMDGRNRLRSAHEREDLNGTMFRLRLVVMVSGEAGYLLEHLPDGRRLLCCFGSEATADVFGATSTRLVDLRYDRCVAHQMNE